ncbi:Phosphoinositide phosphatase SAC6 [Zostera marina]|uniref:Phosphoinositide phosphatase SAC6 n=1 Tax=Zostera marina TaxID=29655 RepID=A0A0K9Q4S2_ZOSMR|nr:Phosphoinositide phosphatase SAC6 [Zostera marina]
MEKVNAKTKIHSKLRLWDYPDQYIVETTDGTSGVYLAISRLDGALSFVGELPKPSGGVSPKSRPIFGIVGMLKLFVGSYLLTISESECVGSYRGHSIFKVSSIQVLQCNASLKKSSGEQKKMETELFSLLNDSNKTNGLFFSYDVNLTLSAQRLHNLSAESKLLPLWRQADPRFLWNGYLSEALIESKMEMDQYILPIIQGSYQNFEANIGKNRVDFTLIARRCTRRTGTRMWRRGADSEGYAANFVESEQIIQSNGFTASYVQIRGSIPVLWEQIVDLTYKPGFEIVDPDEAPRVLERHFLDLKNRYGSVVAIDLVNKHGSEGRLNEKYANTIQHILDEELRYVHFDFHKICGHIHFEKLSLLYNQIEDSIKKHKYFLLNSNGEKSEEQSGVIRTNCIDCLDRTNVTQSMFGRKSLESQLREMGYLSKDETISMHPKFDSNFKILWANHGDDISIQYSGTPALKGDFVRYGKRTFQGIVNDGCNAMGRYYFNNFADGQRQDLIDLLHGHYIVSISRDKSVSSLAGGAPSQSLRTASGLIFAGMIFAIVSLKQGSGGISNAILSLVCAVLSLCIAVYVRINGRIFTDRPRLLKPRH